MKSLSSDILTKSGFLVGNSKLNAFLIGSSSHIQLTPLGQKLKTVIKSLITKNQSKIVDSKISTEIKCPKSKYLETFFQIQRERKIWWMKYSSNPGRFRFSDFIQTEENIRKVNICSAFEFGSIDIESLEVHPVDDVNVSIQSTVSLDEAVMGILLDASEGAMLRLHRNLAPYQVSLLHCSKDGETRLLRDHVFQNLKESGVRMDPEFNKFKDSSDLERLIRTKDYIGIPFDVIVEDEALNSGLLKLRNRDTTISELIHISSLSDYLVKILNSF
ncbi:hypothetical protein ACFFRR_001689 [Megaselia abdita]